MAAQDPQPHEPEGPAPRGVDAVRTDAAQQAGKGESLRRRVGVGGFLVIAVLVVLLDVFVYVSLRDQLFSALDDVLDSRAQFAVELSRQASLPALPTHLQRAGVRAEIHLPDGQAYITRPGATRFEMLPPALRTEDRLVSRTVALPDGANLTVYASRDGVDTTLRRVLVLLSVGTAGLLLVAAVILGLLSRLALRPLDRVVATARRIAQGQTDERLYEDPRDTDISRMAAAFNEMLDGLESAVEEARRSESRSRRFLADAAHQLRTPVTAIRTSAAALIREDDPQDRERLLDNVLRETARTSRLLEMLLRIARLDRGEQPRFEPIDLGALLTEEVDRARDLSPTLRFTLDLEDAPSDRVLGDENGLREALANLLDNARRFATSQVVIRGAADGDDIVIMVSDDGPGLTSEDAVRAFDRFFSLDEGGGAGLGLPIARAVLRTHGGDATYEHGAFVLRLPRRSPDAETSEPTEVETSAETSEPTEVETSASGGGPGHAVDDVIPAERQEDPVPTDDESPATAKGAALGRTPRA